MIGRRRRVAIEIDQDEMDFDFFRYRLDTSFALCSLAPLLAEQSRDFAEDGQTKLESDR